MDVIEYRCCYHSYHKNIQIDVRPPPDPCVELMRVPVQETRSHREDAKISHRDEMKQFNTLIGVLLHHQTAPFSFCVTSVVVVCLSHKALCLDVPSYIVFPSITIGQQFVLIVQQLFMGFS